MTVDHATHQAHGTDAVTLTALAVLVAVTAGYLALARARSREARGWGRWRTASFCAGAALLAAGLVPELSPYPAGSFSSHMHQHLLVGMYAPVALVLGAPVTLALRSLAPRHGRLLGRSLRSRPSHLLAHPVTALALNLGGLAALYLTPLHDAAAASTALHHAVHAHFFAAGYLFAWVIAGPDPAPRRPGVPARLVVLGVAIVGHAVLSQLIYAGALVQVSVPADDRRVGGELMYYGGDVAELVLALAMVTTWRPRRPAPSGAASSSRTPSSGARPRRAPLHPAPSEPRTAPAHPAGSAVR